MVALAVFAYSRFHLSGATVVVALAVFAYSRIQLNGATVVALAGFSSFPIRWTFDFADSVETGPFLTDLPDIEERVLKRNLSIVFAVKKIIRGDEKKMFQAG